MGSEQQDLRQVVESVCGMPEEEEMLGIERPNWYFGNASLLQALVLAVAGDHPREPERQLLLVQPLWIVAVELLPGRSEPENARSTKNGVASVAFSRPATGRR